MTKYLEVEKIRRIEYQYYEGDNDMSFVMVFDYFKILVHKGNVLRIKSDLREIEIPLDKQTGPLGWKHCDPRNPFDLDGVAYFNFVNNLDSKLVFYMDIDRNSGSMDFDVDRNRKHFETIDLNGPLILNGDFKLFFLSMDSDDVKILKKYNHCYREEFNKSSYINDIIVINFYNFEGLCESFEKSEIKEFNEGSK